MRYISFTGFSRYECPHAYWHAYINKTASTVPVNYANSAFGSVVGRVFELYFKNRLWERPDCQDYLNTLLVQEYQAFVQDAIKKGGVVDWSTVKDTEEIVLKDGKLAIAKSLKTIEKHNLRDPDAKVEFKLDRRVGDYIIGGRADFIIRRSPPDNDLLILDGKGTKYFDKYVKKDQLLWYSLLYREHFGQLPDSVGFLFWRRTQESALTLMPVHGSEVDALKSRILSTIKSIEEAEPRGPQAFLPVLSDHCKSFCEFSTGPCMIGTKYAKSCRDVDFNLV